ncbi:unnamed protein product [Malus baccata var. baccata]
MSQSSKNIDADEDWSRIVELLSRIATFRNKSINKWQRKTQVTTGAAAIKSKLHAFNQNIREQVASYMRDPSRMVRQMQMRKSAVAVFGTVRYSLSRACSFVLHNFNIITRWVFFLSFVHLVT